MNTLILEYRGIIGEVEICFETNMLFGELFLSNGALYAFEGQTPFALMKDFKAAVDEYLENQEEESR